MAEEHVECDTRQEVLLHTIDELYHRIYLPQYPNYVVKR